MAEPKKTVTLRIYPQAYNDWCDCADTDNHGPDCKREYPEYTITLALGGWTYADNGTEEGVSVEVIAFDEPLAPPRTPTLSDTVRPGSPE
jgi:hypothetical protein